MWYKSYHINLYEKRFQYSICIGSIKTKTNTKISFSFWLTLFYSIPLLALTDGQKDGQRNKYTRFAWAGGTCPCFAWAGGTFFPVVLLCQFLVLAGNRFWLYILLCTLSTIQLWCCVSFFGSGGKLFLVLRTYLVYNTVVRLCQFFCCGEKVNFVQIPYKQIYISFSSNWSNTFWTTN